jgi:NADH:ubiquinone oxidoreductase subunit E
MDDRRWSGEITDSGFFGAEGGEGADALDPAVVDLVDELVARAPAGRGGLLNVLIGLQRAFDRVSWRVQELVADRFQLSPAQVAGVVSFYPDLSSERRGRQKLDVCTGSGCRIVGGGSLADALDREASAQQEKLEEPLLAVNPRPCLGLCGRAPVLRLNDRIRAADADADPRRIIAEILDPGSHAKGDRW